MKGKFNWSAVLFWCLVVLALYVVVQNFGMFRSNLGTLATGVVNVVRPWLEQPSTGTPRSDVIDAAGKTNNGPSAVPPVTTFAPTTPLADPEVAGIDPVAAGADFFAVNIITDEKGWSTLVEPTNSRVDSPEYCSWAMKFKALMSGAISAQFSHCIELHITGSGVFTFTVTPDSIGYSASDILGTGLAFWPVGVNGDYVVYQDGLLITPMPVSLDTGSSGVNLPLILDASGAPAAEQPVITIVFSLENGFVSMPLGEIRNSVEPVK